MSWCSDAPEDEAISLFAGLLANPDVRLSLGLLCLLMHQIQKRDGRGRTCGGAGHVSLIRRVPVSASERWGKRTKMYMKWCGKHEVVQTLVQSNLLQK